MYVKGKRQDNVGIGALRARQMIWLLTLQKRQILSKQLKSVLNAKDTSTIPDKGTSAILPSQILMLHLMV